MARKYNVSDGKLVLTLTEDKSGGFIITAPMWPGLITKAESLEDSFDEARGAITNLRRTWRRSARCND